MNRYKQIAGITVLVTFFAFPALSKTEGEMGDDFSFTGIKSTNGKLYAYVDLLFYNNVYFVNLIQPNSVSHNDAQSEQGKITAYRNYIKSIKDDSLRNEANLLLDIYLNPSKYKTDRLAQICRKLEDRNIVIQFTTMDTPPYTLSLAYCIFGKKKQIEAKHPFFTFPEPIYNITPYISYPEISISNSTFHSDMVYINTDEVNNDSLIAQRVLSGKGVSSYLFNGARVGPDIKYCLQKAFAGKEGEIKKEVNRMFEIHELTHKALNNQYQMQDLILGEEFALSSTIYANPYLGLAVLYSYIDYDNLTQHKLAALNYIRFVANYSGKPEIISNRSLLARDFTADEIRNFTKAHFESMKQLLNLKQ